MEIYIGESYKLTSDPFNVVINEKYEKKNKSGQVVGEGYKVVGYYSTVEKACVALLHKDLLESEASSIEGLLEVIESTKQQILNRKEVV